MTVGKLINYLLRFNKNENVMLIDDTGNKHIVEFERDNIVPTLKTIGQIGVDFSELTKENYNRTDQVYITQGRNSGSFGTVLSTTDEGYICVLVQGVGIDYIPPTFLIHWKK